jgi:hypothetical protein
MNINTAFWVRVALFNLCIVALLGSIMRYKIGFELPFFDQKYLQESHSHFAFTGWITHTLYFLIAALFRSNLPAINEKRYTTLILVNLLSAYGMLVSFSIQGYGPVSLTFSTISLLTGYVFSWVAYKDANRLPVTHPGKNWIKAALLFSVLSTVGTMVLSWMMATRQFDQTTYLGSIYFYLHFQYNGWFLFACTGLFLDAIKSTSLNPKYIRYSFWLFFLAGIPAYFLSTLWAKIPAWLYVFVVVAAVLQVIGWWFFIKMIRENLDKIKLLFTKTVLLLLLIVALSLSLKLFLQLGSTHPEISHLAFGFRPIVIAYLHLVLLLIVTVFLLVYLSGTDVLHQKKTTRISLLVFVAGVILNEMVLAIQGIAAFSYTVIPLVNEALFCIALLLLGSAMVLAFSQLRSAKN